MSGCIGNGAFASPLRYNFSVSPDLGCHFIRRFSATPTTASSTSAKIVSTTTRRTPC